MLWLGAAGVASGAEPASAQAEREQIRRERAVAEQQYKQAEVACNQRFAVSGCIAEAQAQRRRTIDALRERELVLDETRRQAEAAENRQRLEAKRAEAANRPPPAPHPAASAQAPALPAPSGASAAVHRRSKTADDATEAAARVAAQQRRAADAAAHRREVEQRNAERAARGKNSQPLPVPSAASVAATASSASR